MLKHHNFCVRHSADIAQLTLSHICLSICVYFGSMLILCHIFVELQQFILFIKFDKYHNFIYLQDKHKINDS